MRVKRGVALAALLLLLLGGCGGQASLTRLCVIFTEFDGPPFERSYEIVTYPFPTDGPYRGEQRPARAKDYRSDECGRKCAERRAGRVEATRETARDYDERMYRGWIPADDPRRWQ